MIAVDTSALIAILAQEAEERVFLEAIAEADGAIVGAPTCFEFLMVAEGRLGEAAREAATALLADPLFQLVPWTFDHAQAAQSAFLLFGKGRHPAQLNFGDCMSYATARIHRLPLLFKGGDFTKTDIRSALN